MSDASAASAANSTGATDGTGDSGGGAPAAGQADSADVARLRVFLRSLAAYSVASYVLGFGDRHNDNVMVHRETGAS